MTSTLMTIAKDVKIQVEFNPQTVSEYRLIGYENRVLNEEDFNNDQVDAGEIGAGHSSDDFRFAAAVAAFGQKLRGGKHLGDYSYVDIRELASRSRGDDPFGYRGEFLQLVSLADSLAIPEAPQPEELAMDH